MAALNDEIEEIRQRYSELKPPPKVGYVIDYTPPLGEIEK